MSRLFLALLAVFLVHAATARAGPVRTPHLTADLVSQTRGAAPGSTVWLAMVQTIDPGWHTYWRNPGDAGEPTRLAWRLPAGWRAGEIVWPAPSRFRLATLMNYGYAGRVVLAVPLTVPVSARPGEAAQIQTRMDFLVCADVCVPGTATASLSLPIVAGAPGLDPSWGRPIADALAAAPRPADVKTAFQLAGGQLKLAMAGPPVAGGTIGEAWFYPYDDQLIDQAAPERVDEGPNGLTLALTPGGAFHGGTAPSLVSGVVVADGHAFEVGATRGPPPAGSAGLGPPPERRADLGLPLAAALAFVGGLLLNLMPCVFPVLSMKAASLASLGGDGSRAKIEGLAFFAGVLASFMVLAAAMIGAREAGAALGWGFQLQSPLVVSLLSLVMLAAALNLSGLFEVGAVLQSAGGSVGLVPGVAGAVLTGTLAVVVAAPCTAPFMGPALGWAITAPAVATLAVFAALAIGFAAPFVAISFSPAVLRRLPRPGPWMEGLRRLLAFPMYAAAAWLAWVLTVETGADSLALLLAAAVTLALAGWSWGVSQRRRIAGQRSASVLAVALAGLAASLAMAAAGQAPRPPASAGSNSIPRALPLAGQTFTPERLAALRASGRPVLVNFTAAWCVTCQVNERAVFANGRVARAFARSDAAYLVADWTSRDPAIGRALAREGRIGVPLYLVYSRSGPPQILPQLLTPGLVEDAIARAKSSGPAAEG